MHTRCQKFVPPLCGRDHKEKRGRLKIETKIQDHSIKLSSLYFELLIYIYDLPNYYNLGLNSASYYEN